MKKLFFLLFFYSSLNLVAQKLNYGIEQSMILAAQTNYDPTKPEDGTFRWQNLHTYGIAFFLQKPLKKNYYLQSNFLYRGKGAREIRQSAYELVPNSFEEHELRNPFNYGGLELLIGKRAYSQKKVNLLVYTGIAMEHLLNYTFNSKAEPFATLYPYREYDSYIKNSASVTFGIGLEFNRILTLKASLNKDLTYLINKPTLQVKNTLAAIHIGVNIPRLMKVD
jgi:hypothetical protein